MSKLTESSRGQDCIRCTAPGAYACHYSGPRQHAFGKGRGRKCSDVASAEFCHKCDQVFSEGSTAEFDDKWERSEQFMYWIMMTNIRRIERGVLKV